MPSGKAHVRINFLTLATILLLFTFWGITNMSFYFFFGLGYTIGTYFITPDMDIKSDSYRKWGFLRFIWYPYMEIIPHRSFLSHTLVLGDVIRISYLLLVTSPILYAINKYLMDGNLGNFVSQNKVTLIYIVVGIMGASAVHIISDAISTKRKRLKNKRKKTKPKTKPKLKRKKK